MVLPGLCKIRSFLYFLIYFVQCFGETLFNFFYFNPHFPFQLLVGVLNVSKYLSIAVKIARIYNYDFSILPCRNP